MSIEVRLPRKDLEDCPVTNPAHGGKVDCSLCGAWIYENELHLIKDGWKYTHMRCIENASKGS